MNGVERIAAERQRQIDAEGWTPEHDDDHVAGDMAVAAAAYALSSAGYKQQASDIWPLGWGSEWWKPGYRIRELEKAGALIAAEIDRLTRAGGGEEPRTCLKCGNRSLVAHGGGYKCRDCGGVEKEGTDEAT